MHLFRGTVGGVGLFKGCSEAFLREVVLRLEPQVCIPGEYIVNKNDVARAMFFITRGEVEVLTNYEGKHLAFLQAPQYFGETAILESRKRTASIRASTYADLYYLLAKEMHTLLLNFQEDDEIIHNNALQFLNHGQSSDKNHRSTYAFLSAAAKAERKGNLLSRLRTRGGPALGSSAKQQKTASLKEAKSNSDLKVKNRKKRASRTSMAVAPPVVVPLSPQGHQVNNEEKEDGGTRSPSPTASGANGRKKKNSKQGKSTMGRFKSRKMFKQAIKRVKWSNIMTRDTHMAMVDSSHATPVMMLSSYVSKKGKRR